jgi:hypothetical protein
MTSKIPTTMKSILKVKTQSFLQNYKQNIMQDVLYDNEDNLDPNFKNAIKYVYEYVDRKGYSQIKKAIIKASEKYNVELKELKEWIREGEISETFFLESIL